MFTGIIKYKGVVVSNDHAALVVRVPARVAHHVQLGGSIAVNGICLSVFIKRGTNFTFDIMPETLQVTNVRSLEAGDAVNLEEPLRLGDSLGGHLVQGHVEGVGEIIARAHVWTIRMPRSLMKYIVSKGSIALEGVSLTVVKKTGTRIQVSLLRDTLARTNLQYKGIGDTLNVETDMMNK